MIRDPIPTLRPSLDEVRDQFENWRKTRERNHVQASNTDSPPRTDSGPAFVELGDLKG